MQHYDSLVLYKANSQEHRRRAASRAPMSKKAKSLLMSLSYVEHKPMVSENIYKTKHDSQITNVKYQGNFSYTSKEYNLFRFHQHNEETSETTV